MGNDVNPVYRGLCPYCNGDIEALEAINYGVCTKCLMNQQDNLSREIYSLMKREEEDFKKFFEKTVGSKPWGIQRTWIKRLLNGENVVMIAPTGMGKTTLLLTYVIYRAVVYRSKSIFVTPTRTLLDQVYRKLNEMALKIGGRLRILTYRSDDSKGRKREVLEQASRGEFDILVTTSSFILRNMDKVDLSKVDVVVIDDVDSMLKNSRSVEKTLIIAGFNDELIRMVIEKNRLIWKLLVSKTIGDEERYRNILMRILELDREISRVQTQLRRRQVVVASATGRVKGEYGRVIKELLKTDVSGLTIYGRNVEDAYLLIDRDSYHKLIKLLLKLGGGGLILLSPRHPYRPELLKLIEEINGKLKEAGLRVAEADVKTVKKFIDGEIDVLIGSSNYYGICVRGIDAPQRIRYIVFVGTPVFSLSTEKYFTSLNNLYRALLFLRDQGFNVEVEWLRIIKNTLLNLNPSEVKLLSLILRGKIDEKDVNNDRVRNVLPKVKEIYEWVVKKINEIAKSRRIVEIGVSTIINKENGVTVVTPDVLTYIQASGRTSRLFNGRFTYGLSVIVEFMELENLVKSLNTKLSFYAGESLIKELDLNAVEQIKTKIDTSRNVAEGGGLRYRSILVVVESPTKAKTIARFFGKPVVRRIGGLNIYEIVTTLNGEIVDVNVASTRGHVFDLTTNPNAPNYGVELDGGFVKPIYESIKKCVLCGTQFTSQNTCPKCGGGFIKDSREVIDVLRKISMEVDEVYLATDPDIEGEKIAYDLYVALRNFNRNIYRIEMHEITRSEFLKAIEMKRSIDYGRVNAEIYRRITDRLIGFSLSGKLKIEFKDYNMGAGRVQTPVLGFIINRYEEYRSSRVRIVKLKLMNHPEIYVTLMFSKDDLENYRKVLESKQVVLKLKNTQEIVVKPKPPYTTDQLLIDASKIGYPVNLTMRIAQDLFESGLITYHRTSDTYVSNVGIGIAKQYLESKGLVNLFKPNHWGQQGGHEAIRPVHPLDPQQLENAINEGLLKIATPLTGRHLKVYGLIFNRFIASQMEPYIVVKQTYSVHIGGVEYGEVSVETKIVRNGFNIIDKPRVMEKLHGVGELVDEYIVVYKGYGSTKPLYSEGDVIALMKKEGIGRPSTYSKIIESIIRHGYTVRSRNRNLLIPTKRGIVVYGYLTKHYEELVSVETTRLLEKAIDRIMQNEIQIKPLVEELLGKLMNLNLPLKLPYNLNFNETPQPIP